MDNWPGREAGVSDADGMCCFGKPAAREKSRDGRRGDRRCPWRVRSGGSEGLGEVPQLVLGAWGA